ncbi:hypothetical protein J437_LFUL006141 [Ladona fulva]|uniref:15-oxoprostaglandin 13-reductase n=1 Tax=Ladona fulva TaxID=123851 RepID=A0A8K0K355_LADFU|nr:hypothetical protein J437_LFUL006141 [Ladona fulva]
MINRVELFWFSFLKPESTGRFSNMVLNKKFIMHKRFEGEPKPSDFKLVEEKLPPISEGEFLCKAKWMSVDPYMRPYSARYPLGTTMIGSQVAENTAYFGLLELCQPKAGETVVVTGAAGAVGSIVGQIARIKGCKVIGFAGSDSKCKWLKDELAFDAAFNYKECSVAKALQESAPNGVDCYFDNVSENIIHISTTVIQMSLVAKQLKMEGFLVHRWANRWDEGINQLLEWVQEGKIKYRETISEGFDNMPAAFIGMLRGDNVGKAVVKV